MAMIPPFTNTAPAASDYLAHLGYQLLATWRQRESGQALHQILDEIIQQTHLLFSHRVVLVSLYIYRETGLLYLERVDGELAATIKTPTAHPQGAAATIVAHRKPYFVEEMSKWPPELPPIPSHVLQTNQIGSLIALPLTIGLPDQEEVVGAILISLRTPQRFAPAHRQELWRWAQQVALFVQNARVLRRRRREEEAFQAISASASAGDPGTVATVIAQQICALTKSAFVTVLAHIAQEQRLESCGIARYGTSERTGVIQLDLRQPSINAHVFHTRQPYYAPDLRHDPYHVVYPGWDEEMDAAYCVPLVMNQQALGTVYLTSKEVDGIALDDRNFIEKLAPHAAIALHHAGLIGEERTQRESQAQELEEARDYAIASEAVAWFGITAADRQHTLAQKIGSLRYCTDTLHAWAHLHGLGEDKCIQEIIDDLHSITDDIQAIKSTASSTTPTETSTVVDRELRRSVQRWCNAYNQETDAAIRCQFDLHCDTLKVQVPPNILRIAAEKVVHNALKAMNKAGALTIRSECVGDQIVIDVEDTGPGIPTFALPHFLKRPIQRPPGTPDQGTGMGSHIARIIARRYHGDLTLLETSTAGTKVRLAFPVDET
ncbi:MAG: GAF domain-containing protein [Caldilineaceae bacterium]